LFKNKRSLNTGIPDRVSVNTGHLVDSKVDLLEAVLLVEGVGGQLLQLVVVE